MHEQRARLESWREAVDARLAALVPEQDGGAAALSQAARYALLAPGKRLRPLLTMATAAHLGADPTPVLDAACALEMVHAASLVLDDLPCMDDASLRRGRPAAHLAFGQDVAILAAVAMLSRAFGVLASADALPGAARLILVQRLAEVVGFDGLTAGQTRDLRERDAQAPGLVLDGLNHQKTGVLFALAAETGAAAAGGDARELHAVRTFGERLGAAFQILDDLLDREAAAVDLGKDVGQDAGKPTLVTQLGAEEARRRVQAEIAAAVAARRSVRGPGPLDALLEQTFERATA